jgi:carbon monoxide dehydrogenase subunit G
MKVALEKSYPMPGGPDAVWSFLQNIEGVARCMPGAKITERLDDTHFKGTVAVKVGPASMAFKGNIEVLGLDAEQRTLRLVGKGSDSSGTSGASLDLTARVEPGATADSSNLLGKSEVSMSGKAATFGGRMMGTVAEQILTQFAANFARQVGSIAAQPAVDAPPAIATARILPAQAANDLPDEPANQINALALLWAIIRDWFRGLFRRKPA